MGEDYPGNTAHTCGRLTHERFVSYDILLQDCTSSFIGCITLSSMLQGIRIHSCGKWAYESRCLPLPWGCSSLFIFSLYPDSWTASDRLITPVSTARSM